MSRAAQFLEVLSRVRTVRVSAQSSKGGVACRYAGAGTVQVQRQGAVCLDFKEEGIGGSVEECRSPLKFSNHLRWAIHSESCLQFERMRTGAASVVLRLQVGGDGVWRTLNPHLCRADSYEVTAEVKAESVVVSWRITGPLKNQIVLFDYTRA